ncbi:MAG: hypothetical protein AB1397_03035 [bacterium]
MKITMMSRWNIPCGVSLHAELLGRALVELGHNLSVLAPVEDEDYLYHKDEPYVLRCFRLPKKKGGFFFDSKPFLKEACDIFVVQNLEILPMEDLLEIYPMIRKRAKTVLVIHEGKPPKDQTFYKFAWDAIVCFDKRYKRFLSKIYPKDRIHIIPYPCYPLMLGDKKEARLKLNLPLDKKIIFNYGMGVYRHLHLLPTIERVNKVYPLILLTLTHIKEWYDLFEAVKNRYKFIELRRGKLPVDLLYKYLHACDCLLIHKDSAEAVVVPSTAFLCLGAGRPILAYNTNFFETFDKEVLKYSSLSDGLEDVFEERENVELVLKTSQGYVRKNSSIEIAKKFIKLFKSLLSSNR